MGAEPREATKLPQYLTPALEVLPSPSERPVTVLVADDEAIVRTVIAAMLKRMGYRVLLASDGGEALRMYSSCSHEIGMVIFDLMLPDMTGEQLYEQLRRVKPDLRSMLVTGHSENTLVDGLNLEGVNSVLPKPFDFAELQRAVGCAFAA